MEKKNRVFIATSMDGFIADSEGGINWLHDIPNPDNLDMGYGDFMSEVDALVMGRSTFDTVSSFDAWPYTKPVFVLSNTLQALPAAYDGKATLVKGNSLLEIVEKIHAQGYRSLYIDGGKTIQSFLAADLIDSLTITYIPILLGKGIPLFAVLPHPLKFECTRVLHYSNQIPQFTFTRKRV